jgi:hypothetical protein
LFHFSHQPLTLEQQYCKKHICIYQKHPFLASWITNVKCDHKGLPPVYMLLTLDQNWHQPAQHQAGMASGYKCCQILRNLSWHSIKTQFVSIFWPCHLCIWGHFHMGWHAAVSCNSNSTSFLLCINIFTVQIEWFGIFPPKIPVLSSPQKYVFDIL